jgi:GDPmannose 4,6-dehydratase
VSEFLEEAFAYVNLDWQDYVEIDPWYYRPAEVDLLVGDASKAKRELNWEPRIKFKDLVRLMVDADQAALQAPTGNGHTAEHGQRTAKQSDRAPDRAGRFI